MHISEGVLSVPVLAGGWSCTIILLVVSLRRITYSCLPTMAVFSSIFFLTSLIRVPIGPTSAHFALLGLLGLILGWGTFPAICISLALQAILFQFGGIVALGVNSIVMGLPALLIALIFGQKLHCQSTNKIKILAFISGFGAIFLATCLLYLMLILSNQQFKYVALTLLTANIPLAILEGIITMLAIVFLQKVAPEILSSTNHTINNYCNEV